MYPVDRVKDNRGLSLLELIVVIAIMAVLIGASGYGLSLLVGTEARQAVTKMEAQLNDTKTGTLTKFGEDLVVRYIEVNDSNAETWAKKGVDKSGYYADKCIYTIIMNTPGNSMKQSYSDKHEFSHIGPKKVDINVYYDSGNVKIDSSNAVRIRFKRDSGEIEKLEIGSVNASDEFVPSSTGTIDRMEFKAGLRTYVIKFTPLTGQFSISTS